jgi:hypothetical protein
MTVWREIINGELLGDGHIRQFESGSCMYAHFSKHEQYLEWLSQKLLKVGFSTKITSQIHDRAGKQHKVYRLRTKADSRLEAIHNNWYNSEVKSIPDELKLTPLILRQWYIGDGTGFIGTQQNQVKLTSQLTEKEGTQMVTQLDDKGITASQQANGSLYIWKNSHNQFFEYMAELPQELNKCFGYKWRLA